MFSGVSVAVAQLVERWIVDPAVAGSKPVGHPSGITHGFELTLLARGVAGAYHLGMSGPSTKPKPHPPKEPVFVSHPDDAEQAREAFEAVERGDVLSAESSAAYLRSLLGEGDPPET